MLLSQIAAALRARIVNGGDRAAATEVYRVVASSLMSELLGLAQPGVLPLTDLDSAQVVGALQLLDVECLGLMVAEPSLQVLGAARRAGLVLLACPPPLSSAVRVAQQLGLPCLGQGGARP